MLLYVDDGFQMGQKSMLADILIISNTPVPTPYQYNKCENNFVFLSCIHAKLQNRLIYHLVSREPKKGQRLLFFFLTQVELSTGTS